MTNKSIPSNKTSVAVVGAGLAGSEAALVLASLGIDVTLFEMRPALTTPAHKTDLPAELVCSNSFKSDELPTAHGLLKAELSLLQSPLIAAARETSIPAGSALAVDRMIFSAHIKTLITNHPRICFKQEECIKPPEDYALSIIAAGPLASDSLTDWLGDSFSSEALNFYDAIAPIVSADSIDMDKAFYASRWNKGSADYCNCPFTEEEYRIFYDALLSADRVNKREFESERFFEACLPVEVMAQRDYGALLFGPLRPVGIFDPQTDKRPFAVCQLRKENAAGESLGMVGFQTRMTIPEQRRVLRLIPGMEHAEFLRFGSIHRNTYLDSPKLLAGDLSFKTKNTLFLAGQMCGSEGYTESIATGHLAALFAWAQITGVALSPIPPSTACGALLQHVTSSQEKNFTPSNINFGLIESLPSAPKKLPKTKKRELLCERGISEMRKWIRGNVPALG